MIRSLAGDGDARDFASAFVESVLASAIGHRQAAFSIRNGRAIAGQVRKQLTKEDSLVFLPIQTCVLVGDIHGNLESLLQIFSRHGWPPSTFYVFLGDYVDRGINSCEVILLLLSLKLLYPEHLLLLRGNHESPSMARSYGFATECTEKYSPLLFWDIMDCFGALPIAAVVNGNLCVHGGISHRYETLDDIAQSEKNFGGEVENVVVDLLWSDPSIDLDEFGPSPRGAGSLYGAVAVRRFLKRNRLQRIIRAHESCPKGYEFPFRDDTVVTIFSSYDYCGMSNDAAVAILSASGSMAFSRFNQPGRILYPSVLLSTPKLSAPELCCSEGAVDSQCEIQL
jgi:diadenosine tetraphosphatase ApaH/serine/threonine PP2A family protein phosphatase